MRKVLVPLVLATIVLLAGFAALKAARSQAGGGDIVLSSETQGGNTRQITAPEGALDPAASPDQPNISFIDSPTVGCIQPDPNIDACYINWYYMSVSSDPNYMITMTVMLNDFGFVGQYHGFFQMSMYVPYNMNPDGYKVACGALGAGGNPYWGEAYGYTIRARDSANLKSANYGTVYCPAYTP